MKRIRSFLGLTVLLTVVICLSSSAALADTADTSKEEQKTAETEKTASKDSSVPAKRTWTDTSGKTIEATYVGYRNGMVYLRKPDGKTVAVSYNKLSKEDQELVKQYVAAETAKQKEDQAEKNAEAEKKKELAKHRMQGTLTDEETSEFKEENIDQESKDGYKLYNCSFAPAKLSAAEMTKYKRSGKIPYRITFSLYAAKEYRGKIRMSMTKDSDCEFYVLDAAGDLVGKKQNISLGKMCPS